VIVFSFLLLRPPRISEALKKGSNFGFLTLNLALGQACMEKVSCIYSLGGSPKLQPTKMEMFNFLRTTVKLGNKERFDKELIGIKEPFPVTNLPFTS
jgi:hypothetical protein